MDYIDTFERRFEGLSHEQVAAAHPSSWGARTPPTGAVSDHPPLEPFVDGSRWIVVCPDPACGGAERANFETNLFFCCECRNAAVGHDFIRTEVPAVKDEVEATLLERPDWRYRAWLPDETVADLAEQNLRHLIGE